MFIATGFHLRHIWTPLSRPCHRCHPFEVRAFEKYNIKTIFIVGWRTLPPFSYLYEKQLLEMPRKSLDLRSQVSPVALV